MTAPGARVGAILDSDLETVRLLGYGVFVGDEVPPQPMGMWAALFGATWEAFDEAARKEGYAITMRPTNPKILLDSGKVVWGCECWWGDEDRIRKSIGTKRVVDVDIDDARKARP